MSALWLINLLILERTEMRSRPHPPGCQGPASRCCPQPPAYPAPICCMVGVRPLNVLTHPTKASLDRACGKRETCYPIPPCVAWDSGYF